MSSHDKSPELLAPAGDRESLDAALEAGADAVYFGLSTLNARRRAKNFRSDTLAAAVEAVHAHGARAYLTLNIDLAQRDVGQAARMLELARQSHIDAVLVRDPALLALRPFYAELEFHFSTQTCMANSADAAAARELGAARVVLAREMSLREIEAASAVPGVQTEVFVQGALCFSISGRCLMSSWIGGRSGNRGTCTSPCRVPWTADGQALGTPFSMCDLAAIERLGELCRAGVAGLKIEGRLKSPAWVRRAVELYRRALDGQPAALAEAAELGAYTGRTLTCGCLDAERNALTGSFGRQRSPVPAADEAIATAEPDPLSDETSAADDGAQTAGGNHYDLDILVTERAIECRCRCGDRTFDWPMPKTVIHRPNRAVSVANVFQWLEEMPIQGCCLGQAATNDPEFLLVRRAAAALSERISASILQARRTLDDPVRVDLPPAVRQRLEKESPAPANDRALGEAPNRARLEASAVAGFLRRVRPEALIVEGLTARHVEAVRAACGTLPFVAALPSVFFEDEIATMRDLLAECARAHVAVEVDSWGGWHLARQAGVRMESGPGLPVLNSLAARQLADLGMRCVTLSPEADRKQLEEASSHCSAACSLIVFGRPALFTARVDLSDATFLDRVVSDRRGARVRPRRERGLWTFRPVEPYDLRDCRNERIRARHLVVDLVGCDDPVSDWRNPPEREKPFRFNYDRTLA